MSKLAVLSRGFIVSTLSFCLTACMNLQAPQPVIKSDIPQQFAQTHVGTSIAEQGYKTFFSDPRLAAQRRLVSATDTTYTLSTARFRAGIDSYLTVLDAQRSAYAAQQGLLILEQTKLNNQIELYKTLGGGL